MAGKTAIEWTDATWNPLRGCARVSDGCRHCYAERMAARFSGPGRPFEGLAEMTEYGPRWTGMVSLVEKHLDDPLHWQKSRKIFVNSVSDLFHSAVPDEWIDRIFAVMALTPQHTYQILTKRSERMRDYLADPARLGEITMHMSDEFGWLSPDDAASIAPADIPSSLPKWPSWPLPNVWLGVSVENQKAADERIPLLLRTPATVRFLSMEPLLGPVNIGFWLDPTGHCCGDEPEFCHCMDNYPYDEHGAVTLDWIIVGGESGPGARPMHPDWVRSIRDQCQAAGVPLLVKQWGEWLPLDQATDEQKRRMARTGRAHEAADGTPGLWGRIGKHAAGAILDGQEWREWPMSAK